MNFLKWILDIFIGFLMYVPKKILKILKNQHNDICQYYKRNVVSITLFAILLLFSIPSLYVNEESIMACFSCQSFIQVMTSLFPGILAMSHHSEMPQLVLFELSIAYLTVPILIFLMFIFRHKGVQTSGDKLRVAFIYGLIYLICATYISFYDLPNLFLSDSDGGLFYPVFHTRFGISFYIGVCTVFSSMMFAGFILVSIEMVRKFNKDGMEE